VGASVDSYGSVVLLTKVSDVQIALADRFARMVRSAPAGGLELVMRTPARRAILDGIFWQMPRHFAGRQGAGLTAIVHWHITTGRERAADIYTLAFDQGRCRTRRGRTGGAPQLTITLEAAEFVRLATGNADPMKAYFGGRIKLAGDIMLAAKLQALFRIPGRSGQPTRTVSSSR
jgi:putative sterol carrier protein